MSSNPIINVQRRVTAAGIPAPSSLRAWALAALEGATPGEITIRVVAEEESAKLNGKFRHKPYATNVLSFPYEAEALSEPVLGDLVICAPVVAREAKEQNKTVRAHWAHMVVHGCLHLQGHDHEKEAEASAMESLEIRILGKLGFKNPYLEQ